VDFPPLVDHSPADFLADARHVLAERDTYILDHMTSQKSSIPDLSRHEGSLG
jgi:hypothetical protein